MSDVAYLNLPFRLNEIEHEYGDKVHILSDPFAATLLAKLCLPQTIQPQINQLVRRLYERLLVAVVNNDFPRSKQSIRTRMTEFTPLGAFEAELIDPAVEVVSVDIARAGILPSLLCYEILNELLDPALVRQDHLMISRVVNPSSEEVQGAQITGGKVGGPVGGRIVLFPDPMGATGSSLSTAIQFYKDTHGGVDSSPFTLNLIITPEFIQKIHQDHPEVEIYTLRLDRAASSPEILGLPPGTRHAEESGLNEKDYIVPGGGGFGEIMNNSWV